MYYSCVKSNLEAARAVELLYLGEQFLLSPQKDGVAVTNCRTEERTVFENVDALCADAVFSAALHEEDYSKVWVGLEADRLYASEDEFLGNLYAGGEIECIYRGMGFFIGQQFGASEPTWQMHNAYLHESQFFRSPAELWERAQLLGRPLRKCITEVEIIMYL